MGGIALFGTIGGLAGNHVAEEQGATGWEKAAYISGGILIGGTVGGLGGYYLAPAVIGATGVTGISASAAGITTITATGTSSVALYQTIEQGLNFAVKAKEHMNDPNRYVPMSLLIEAIRHGTATPDPRGSDAIMYTIELIRNSTPYILEVLYHAETNSVWHFMYYRG